MMKTLVMYSTYSLEPDAMSFKMQNAPNRPPPMMHEHHIPSRTQTSLNPVGIQCRTPTACAPLSRQFNIYPSLRSKTLDLQLTHSPQHKPNIAAPP